MKAKIIWQRWLCPYSDHDEAITNSYDDPQLYNPFIDEEFIEERPIKTLFGPLGPIPLNEYSLPSKIFNFWMAHTNFLITAQLLNIIKKVEGVEVLTVFTPYRFRIAVGKAFKDRTVMDRVNQAVLKALQAKAVVNPVLEQLNGLSK